MAYPDLRMIQSNLLILLLLNLAFAATLDNVPEEETNRVRRRGPSSSDASEKRTEFMEECGGDAACVRGKMRDWRKAKKAGEPSLDRRARRARKAGEPGLDRRVHQRGPSSSDASEKRTQFMERRTQFIEECRGFCSEGLCSVAACVRGKMRYWRKANRWAAGGASLDRRARRHVPSSSDASEKRTEFMEECGGDAACVRGKMRDWRKARKAGEPSF